METIALDNKTMHVDRNTNKILEEAAGEGFTTALWRQSNEITTVDCGNMFAAAGFTHLTDTNGNPKRTLSTSA
jgi:hypothetical protein